MRNQSRYNIPKTILILFGLVLLSELVYLAFFDQWLNQWAVFRFHLPSVLVLAVLLLATAIDYYEYNGIGSQHGIVRRGQNKPYVAITFDDGPNPKYTPRILDILKARQAPAAFFMCGRHVEKYSAVARRAFAEGHEIGNHTYSHRDLVSATKKTIIKEVTKTDEAIARVIGIRTRLFRPPRGIMSNTARQTLVEMGFTIALWTVSAVDWRGDPPHALVKRVMRQIKKGGIILFHDSGALIRAEGGRRGNTVEALPMVIDELRQRGYEIVPLSCLIREVDHIEADDFIEVLQPSSGF